MSQKISENPMLEIEFSGLHWIEASAGTGKTYTLTGLMIRIFLEKYLPKQVVATTFTRKAAAELSSRIRLRLNETLLVLEHCRGLLPQEIELKIVEQNDALLRYILQKHMQSIGYACERLYLVKDQLDELFVGTLDSFSQKLLREFAFESGRTEHTEITDEEKNHVQQLIHDILREWIEQQPQDLIDVLVANKQLKSVDDYAKVVEKSLNFASARFISPQVAQFNLPEFQRLFEKFTAFPLNQIEALRPYCDAKALGQYLHGNQMKPDVLNQILFVHLKNLQQTVQQQGLEAYFVQTKDRDMLKSIFYKKDGELRQSIFKKCSEEIVTGFYQHPIIVLLEELILTTEDLSNLDDDLKYHIAMEVKKRLPLLLQQKGQTTFSQQIRTLAESLQGQHGQHFATFVQSRYPLILVDEFQDTNQDQDNMLASIWREPSRLNQGCMIMVGDRKQAIYGFRGGDMLTFLNAQQDVLAKAGRSYELTRNFRSITPLVNAVDQLFQRQPDFGEEVLYRPIQAGKQHVSLIDLGEANPQPLRWLSVEAEHEAEQVAWKIRALLNQSRQKTLYFDEDGQSVAIIENHIAVLAKSHKSLDKVQYALMSLGIAVNRPAKRSIFSSALAQDVGALLTAILHPEQEGKVKRALLSRLLGFRIQDLIQYEQHADGLSAFIAQFTLIREMWVERGFLAAWQACLQYFKVWTTLVATQHRDNERSVVNLRHITDILSRRGEQHQGAHYLYQWYLKQLQSPSQREWELERPLSNATGVKLMTIHQSKGLEFEIVFLLGTDTAGQIDYTLNFSVDEQINTETGQTQKTRILEVYDKQRLDEKKKQQHKARQDAEQHRLWYVALTRASYRVYALLLNGKGSEQAGLNFWRNAIKDQTFEHPAVMDEPLLLEKPQWIAAEKVEKPFLSAQKIPTQRFYPQAKTSFSALARHLNHGQLLDHLANQNEQQASGEDESIRPHLVRRPQQGHQPLAWIKAHFPMGTQAGLFLHEIFEHIDFKNDEEWTLELQRRFKNDYSALWKDLLQKVQTAFPELPEVENSVLDWMKMWLTDILTTPLLTTPLTAEFCLQYLATDHHLSEVPFFMALADHVLAVKRIQNLFEDEGIQMPAFNEAYSARYLTGSIDLVFYDGQQYHLADYKSNFLGTDQADYATDAIAESMSHASYWLQAALYLVALHRYLSLNLADYDIDRDLGSASYLYLRGMNGQAQQGVYTWRPSSEFILRLNAVLGEVHQSQRQTEVC